MRRRVSAWLAVLAIGLWEAGTVGVAEAAGIDLTGNWEYFVGPRPVDGRLATLHLKQEGDKLTGKAVIPGGRTQEIQGGKVMKNKLSFFIENASQGVKVYFAGDLSGDTIKGKTEFERPGVPKRPHFGWEAKRVAD